MARLRAVITARSWIAVACYRCSPASLLAADGPQARFQTRSRLREEQR